MSLSVLLNVTQCIIDFFKHNPTIINEAAVFQVNFL